MKNILTFSLIAITIFLFSCQKEPVNTTIVSMKVDIAYQDVSGTDLLNPASPNHFSADSIHVYNVVDGVKEERYYSNLDNPTLWDITKPDSSNNYYLRVDVETDTTIIALNKTISPDTLSCSIDRDHGNFIITKVWYNGDLKWSDNMTPREFVITR